MSIIGSNILAGASGQGGAYEIEQSLRFNDNDSAWLNKTFASDGNLTTWTWSGWVKRSGSFGSIQHLFGWQNFTGGNFQHVLGFNGTDNLSFLQYNSVSGGYLHFQMSNAVYRDPSAWYHVVAVFDTNNATAADRVRLYVNGERITSLQFDTQASSGREGYINDASYQQGIGRAGDAGSWYLDGYLAEVNFIDGSALDHEDFGELDDNGVWRPIKYAGSYTGNSFYLKFDAADVGGDSSGLGNDWTPSPGISTSGTGTDVMSDTPTTNWCTLNPLDTGGATLSNGNLVHTTPSTGYGATRGTISVSSGKWYWEVEPTSLSGGVQLGILGVSQTVNTSTQIGGQVTGYSYINNGDRYGSGSYTVGWGDSFTTGDVIGVALDMDAGDIEFFKNGTSQGTAFTGLSGTFAPALSDNSNSASSAFIYNFGQRDFAYTPPTGFNALNTANLSAPDIADGSKYFNTVLWTGTSAENSISTVGFQPDFTWIKGRDNNTGHILVDAVRGATKVLESDLTAAEYTNVQSVKSFDTNGFTLGTENDVNNSTAGYNQYVGWNWLAANGTETNEAGSITSTVSANPTAGFSIATYTGNGGTSATVGHGLGVVPDLIIIKSRSTTDGWAVYHSSVGATGYLALDGTDAVTTSSSTWGNTSPTSTVFTVNSNSRVNSSTGHVAYCFAEVEGYSKFGSYTGNGSTDGVFIYCGFKPAFFMCKRTDSTGSWIIFDNDRIGYNQDNNHLLANASDAEYTDLNTDIVSNGFKFRSGGGDHNGSGATYIFAAFAEHPTGGSGISPATAR